MSSSAVAVEESAGDRGEIGCGSRDSVLLSSEDARRRWACGDVEEDVVMDL